MFSFRPTHVTLEGPLATIELCDPLRVAVPVCSRLNASFIAELLAEMLDDPHQARQVARLLASTSGTRPPPRRVLEATLQKIEAGTLHARFTVARWVEELRGWEEPEPRPLVPSSGPTDGPGHGPAPYEELRTTWLSFDVVDDGGQPLPNGRFDVVLDGRVEGGPLDDEVRRYQPLREQATAALGMQSFYWSYDPGRTGSDPHPSTGDEHGSLTFEVLDQDGNPASGEYTLTGAATEPTPLDGVHEHEVTERRATLRLHALSFSRR